MRGIMLLLLFGVLVLYTGCRESNSSGNRLIVATTTSLYDTGLWDDLEPMFETEYGIGIDVVYAGTGRALELARLGDVDVITVHSKSREQEFINNGFGVERIPFAYNYYVIVGPTDDPAGIRGKTPERAFELIAETGSRFVSRGDDSGTHGKEKDIWEAVGFDYLEVSTSEEWYVMGGSGMGATLIMADEMDAYTISDIGTFLSYRDRIQLQTLVESGDILLNVYSVIEVTSTEKPEEAELFIEFLLSPETQDFIGEYGTSRCGRALFIPCLDSGMQ